MDQILQRTVLVPLCSLCQRESKSGKQVFKLSGDSSSEYQRLWYTDLHFTANPSNHQGSCYSAVSWLRSSKKEMEEKNCNREKPPDFQLNIQKTKRDSSCVGTYQKLWPQTRTTLDSWLETVERVISNFFDNNYISITDILAKIISCEENSGKKLFLFKTFSTKIIFSQERWYQWHSFLAKFSKVQNKYIV